MASKREKIKEAAQQAAFSGTDLLNPNQFGKSARGGVEVQNKTKIC